MIRWWRRLDAWDQFGLTLGLWALGMAVLVGFGALVQLVL